MADLDVRTLFAMLVLATALMALMLALGVRGAKDGLAQWKAGLVLITLGWILLSLRGTAPDVLTCAAANAFFLTGLGLGMSGLLAFHGRDAKLAPVFVAGAVYFAVLIPVMADFRLLFAVTSFVTGTVLIAGAAFVRGLGTEGGTARNIMVGLNLASGLVMLARGVTVVLFPEAIPTLFTFHPVQAASFVAVFALTIGNSVVFLLMHRDRAEAQIRRLAMVDSLTGLLNRRALLEQAERELARARRGAVPFTVLMIDLDHFKRVNDLHGHQAGDRVLAEFAQRLADCVRTEDLVGRYGGEEFCAVLPGASLERALAVGERIRAATEARPLGGLDERITVSVGAAVLEPGLRDVTVDAALAQADAALYAAKKGGRNRVVGGDAHDPLSSLSRLAGHLSLVA